MRRLTLAIAAALLVSACSENGKPADHASNKTAENASKTAENASTSALRSATGNMHEGMEIEFTGDPDTDFLRAMIPHHQGAIDMARAELQHGRDPQVRELAQKIVDAQAAEIGQMRAWLAKRGEAEVKRGSGESAHK